MFGRRTLGGAIAIAAFLCIPALALAAFVPDFPAADYAGVPAGLLIGWPFRPLIRSWRDVRIPWVTAAVAGACVAIVQLAVWRFVHDPPTLIKIGMEAIACATGMAAQRLRAFDRGHAAAIERHEMKDLQRWTRELEAKPPPGRIVGGARVRCAGCDELVDAGSTQLVADRGMLCPECR